MYAPTFELMNILAPILPLTIVAHQNRTKIKLIFV